MSDKINRNPMPVDSGMNAAATPGSVGMAGAGMTGTTPLGGSIMDDSMPTRDMASSDASGGRHTVACLFETREAADRAAQDVVAAGTARAAVEIVDQQQGQTSAGTGTGGGGMWESIKRMFTGEDDTAGYYEGVSRGNVLLTVHAMSAAEAERAGTILERHDPIDLDAHEANWRESGWTGAAPHDVAPMDAPPAGMATDLGMAKPPARTEATGAPMMAGRATNPASAGAEQVIPVIEEHLAIGKRAVSGGRVRVHASTVETPVEQDVQLRDERVQVERRRVDRPLEDGAAAFQERNIELTETREEAVVGKTARVVEEVVVRKNEGERTERVKDTTRRTDVTVDDDRTGTPAAPRR